MNHRQNSPLVIARTIQLAIALMLLASTSLLAQRKDVPVAQVDTRFKFSVQKHWAEGNESYFFEIQNTTPDKYSFTFSITLDLACVGTKHYTLGASGLKVITLAPNEKFSTEDLGQVFTYVSGGDNFKACRLPEGSSFTLFKSLTSQLSNVKLVIENKAGPIQQNAPVANTTTRSAAPASQPSPAKTGTNAPTPTPSNSAASSAAQKRAAEMARAEAAAERELAELKRRNAAQQDYADRQSAETGKIIDGVSSMAVGLMNDANRNRAREANEALRREEMYNVNAAKAEIIFRHYLTPATQGNEEAIAKIAEAYLLAQERKKRIDFLNDMLNKHNSTAANKALMSHYTGLMNAAKAESKRHVNIGIKSSILGAVFGAGGVLLGTLVPENEDPDMEDLRIYGGAGVTVVGAAFLIAGIVHFGLSGYKNNPDYYHSRKMVDYLYNRRGPNFSFSPTFNPRDNNLGLAMRVRF